jgi:hypothetical protein
VSDAQVPAGLSDGGADLWLRVTEVHTLDVSQEVQLLEACRAKDRLDKLDELLRGDVELWAKLTHSLRTEDYELRIDEALVKANATANVMKQLLAAMRLPEATTGKRPQLRAARGAYAKSSAVSSLDRARAAKSS